MEIDLLPVLTMLLSKVIAVRISSNAGMKMIDNIPIFKPTLCSMPEAATVEPKNGLFFRNHMLWKLFSTHYISILKLCFQPMPSESLEGL